jgi:nitrite reductase/ring-hydroxylating ferredoxin subunit
MAEREKTDHPPRVPHVGTYRRELPVTLERMYENAIDWEHLPYLHRSSFARIECLDAGEWGFRAHVWAQPYDERRRFIIELKLDRELNRWITRTLDGPGIGSEVWTHAFALGERRTLVVVDFFVPGASVDRAPELGRIYRELYSRLYDEDESMMTGRQAQLDLIRTQRAEKSRRILGSLADVRARLPMRVDAGGRSFRVIELDGRLVAHATVCPHRLGPLGDGPIRDGVVECPWHGYRFDIVSRKCISGAQKCSLPSAPTILVDRVNSEVVLEWSAEAGPT